MTDNNRFGTTNHEAVFRGSRQFTSVEIGAVTRDSFINKQQIINYLDVLQYTKTLFGAGPYVPD